VSPSLEPDTVLSLLFRRAASAAAASASWETASAFSRLISRSNSDSPPPLPSFVVARVSARSSLFPPTAEASSFAEASSLFFVAAASFSNPLGDGFVFVSAPPSSLFGDGGFLFALSGVLLGETRSCL
jgi:hypothetical protein